MSAKAGGEADGLDSLSFGHAEFESAGDAPGVEAPVCLSCAAVIFDQYYTIGQTLYCPACCAALVHVVARGPGAVGIARAAAFGLGAAVIGAALWAAVTMATGYEIGLIGIAVGYFVGLAVRRGSGGLGGRAYQGLAVVLTYLAIVSMHVPAILQQLSAPSEEAVRMAESGTGDSFEGQLTSGSKPAASGADLVVRLVVALAIAMAVPFLAGFDNAIGILIIGFALWEAGRLTRPLRLEPQGPYQVGSRGAGLAALSESH